MTTTSKKQKQEQDQDNVAVEKEQLPVAAKAEHPSEAAQKAQQQAQAQQQTIVVDDSDVTSGYANFCRVSSTPEELILDLGMNPNPYAPGEATVKVSQRIILNHYTAKRLLSALSLSLQRHEQTFGVLETDVRKRIITQQ